MVWDKLECHITSARARHQSICEERYIIVHALGFVWKYCVSTQTRGWVSHLRRFKSIAWVLQVCPADALQISVGLQQEIERQQEDYESTLA